MKKEYEKLQQYIAPSAEIVNLSMNENHHLHWMDKISEDLNQSAETHVFTAYGDDRYTELANAYAAYADVQPENIVVTTGSEFLIGLLFSSLVEEKLLLTDPDFFRFAEIANLQRLNVYKTPLWDGVNVEAIIELINKENIELFIFSNPNNPLGTMIEIADVKRILDETNCYIVSDEAYMEFAGQSAVEFIETYPKLIVMRTMSKAWGLAGMRIGYAIANKDLAHYLKKSIGPFNVNPFSAKIVAQAMKYEDYMTEKLQEIIAIRDNWSEKLVKKYGFSVYPSHTNFINAAHPDAFAIWQFLRDNKLAVSKFAPHNLRISIGTEAEMARLEELLDVYFTENK